jgi:hypothetical protein
MKNGFYKNVANSRVFAYRGKSLSTKDREVQQLIFHRVYNRPIVRIKQAKLSTSKHIRVPLKFYCFLLAEFMLLAYLIPRFANIFFHVRTNQTQVI